MTQTVNFNYVSWFYQIWFQTRIEIYNKNEKIGAKKLHQLSSLLVTQTKMKPIKSFSSVVFYYKVKMNRRRFLTKCI